MICVPRRAAFQFYLTLTQQQFSLFWFMPNTLYLCFRTVCIFICPGKNKKTSRLLNCFVFLLRSVWRIPQYNSGATVVKEVERVVQWPKGCWFKSCSIPVSCCVLGHDTWPRLPHLNVIGCWVVIGANWFPCFSQSGPGQLWLHM